MMSIQSEPPNRRGIGLLAVVGVLVAAGAIYMVSAWRGDGPSPAVIASRPDAGPGSVNTAGVGQADIAPPAPPSGEQAATPTPVDAGASAPENRAKIPDLQPIRQIPRKKLPLVSLDLDGDGAAEQLIMTQRQPADNWRGKDRSKGPHFIMEIRAKGTAAKPGKLLGRKDRYGWGQGWAKIGVRSGGGGHVAMVYWGVPEAHEPRASYAWLEAGKVRWGEFKRLPLYLIDLNFAQQESVLTLSQELYHDYLKRGTTELLSWVGDNFVSVLEKPVFELCVVAVREPQILFAAVPTDKRSLQLLLPSDNDRAPLTMLWKTTVKPPSEGPLYNVPTGFALSCDRDKQQVQYKRRRFQLAGEAFVALPDALPLGQAPAEQPSQHAGTPEAGTPEAGTPEAGTPEAGTLKAGHKRKAAATKPSK